MNNCAIVATISDVKEIVGADNIQLGVVLGTNVILSKNKKVGDVGVLFIDGLSLSKEFLEENNLYRNKLLNKDNTKSGFFCDAGRVRCQRFMGVNSEGFFCDLSMFDKFGGIHDDVGWEFDTLNGTKICEKYLSEKSKCRIGNANTKSVKKNICESFLRHVDTGQFSLKMNEINEGDLIYIQSKKHGTSGRTGYLEKIVEPKGWWDKLKSLFGLFNKKEWGYVVGTRNTIIESLDGGFYGDNGFRFSVSSNIEPHLQKGMTAYYEIVGWANKDSLIMPQHKTKDLKNKEYTKKYGDVISYSYGTKKGEADFHIYRLTHQVEDGSFYEYSEDELEQWCSKHGFKAPVNVCEPFKFDGLYDALASKVKELTERPECLCEDFSDSSHISEGVVIRVERKHGGVDFYKSKSFAFKVMEGIAKEVSGDLEDES